MEGGLRIVYFAWVREQIGKAEEEIALPEDVSDIAALVAMLAGKGGGYAAALGDTDRLRFAVDREFAEPDAALQGVREVAIFPPVTGG